MEEPPPNRVGPLLRMRKKRKSQRVKRSPRHRAITAPLWPARYCIECRKMLPDITKKGDKWVRPGRRESCSKECDGAAQRRGGMRWIRTHHPEILHLFEN